MNNLPAIIDLIIFLNTLSIIVFLFFRHLYDEDIKSHWLFFAKFNCSIYFIWNGYYFLSLSRSIIDNNRGETLGLFLVKYSIVGAIAFALYLIINLFWVKYHNKSGV